MFYNENISFSTIGVFLIKKPLPIALMSILSMFDRNWYLKYLNRKDDLRCIVKGLAALLKR